MLKMAEPYAEKNLLYSLWMGYWDDLNGEYKNYTETVRTFISDRAKAIEAETLMFMKQNGLSSSDMVDSRDEHTRLGEVKDIDSGVRYHDGRTHFFYGKVFCGECGEPMTRRTLRGYKGERYKAWTCRDRHKGRRGNGCMCRTIRETDLITAICVQMDWEQFDEGRFEAEIEKVVVTNDEITLMRRLIPVTA